MIDFDKFVSFWLGMPNISEQESTLIHSALQAQGLKCVDGKIVPISKFKVGDFVKHANQRDIIYQVEKVFLDGTYRIVPLNADMGFAYTSATEAAMSLWTLDDAKDGDILYTQGGVCYENPDIIFIFKGIGQRDYLDEPCIDYHCSLIEDSFNVAEGTQFMGVLSTTKHRVWPATREQRSSLEKVMYESGYVWDDYNKKLSNIDTLKVREMMCPKNDVSETDFGKTGFDKEMDKYRQLYPEMSFTDMFGFAKKFFDLGKKEVLEIAFKTADEVQYQKGYEKALESVCKYLDKHMPFGEVSKELRDEVIDDLKKALGK